MKNILKVYQHFSELILITL